MSGKAPCDNNAVARANTDATPSKPSAAVPSVEAQAMRVGVSGCMGSLVAVTCLHHLDVVKSHIQIPDNGLDTVLGTYRALLQRGGVAALYHGLYAEYFKTSISNFSYIYVYTYLNAWWNKRQVRRRQREQQRRLQQQQATQSTSTAVVVHVEEEASAELAALQPIAGSDTSRMLCGMIAGCITRPLTNPLTLIQTRMLHSGLGFLQTGRQLVREEGVMALWTGLLPSLILTANPSIQYVVFDRLKGLLVYYLNRRNASWRRLKRTKSWLAMQSSASQERVPQHVAADDGAAEAVEEEPLIFPSAWQIFVIGIVAKTVATVVTYPYIMAKVRMQFETQHKNVGAVQILRRVAREEGLTGWYRGMQAQILKSVATTALMFVCKEKIEYLSHKYLGA